MDPRIYCKVYISLLYTRIGWIRCLIEEDRYWLSSGNAVETPPFAVMITLKFRVIL